MISVIRFDACKPVPWKNGAGATRELWKLEDAEGILARISVAEITGDQPFSSFPGIDRMILQLEGPPMTLTFDGHDCPLIRLHPHAFAGEAAVTCRLDGEGRALDLNLMCRRGAFSGMMKAYSAVAGEAIRFGYQQVVSALLARAPCRLNGSGEYVLDRYDLLLVKGSASIIAEQDFHFVQLTATPLAMLSGVTEDSAGARC